MVKQPFVYVNRYNWYYLGKGEAALLTYVVIVKYESELFSFGCEFCLN